MKHVYFIVYVDATGTCNTEIERKGPIASLADIRGIEALLHKAYRQKEVVVTNYILLRKG